MRFKNAGLPTQWVLIHDLWLDILQPAFKVWFEVIVNYTDLIRLLRSYHSDLSITHLALHQPSLIGPAFNSSPS
jgi:hypothetical protein